MLPFVDKEILLVDVMGLHSTRNHFHTLGVPLEDLLLWDVQVAVMSCDRFSTSLGWLHQLLPFLGKRELDHPYLSLIASILYCCSSLTGANFEEC